MNPKTPGAATLGVFDGVHRGHQAVLSRVSLALTFDPPPAEVLSGAKVPLICTLEKRLLLMKAAGAERIEVLRFDKVLAETSAEDFIARLKGMGVKRLVLGYDSRFGKGRRGDAALASSLGLEAETVDPVPVGGRPAASRRIREAIRAGDLEDAKACLGRDWAIEGRVVKGDGRGRGIGFPTANLETGPLILPKGGVYGGRCVVQGRTYPAAMNVGTRPTVDGARVVVEAHLVGFSGDLYGKALSVELLKRIRDERKFESVDDLRIQIARDLALLPQ